MADIARYPLIRHLRGTTTAHVQHVRNGKTIHAGTGDVLVPPAQRRALGGSGRRP